MVYILEAHPTDVWQMRSNLKDEVLFASPRSEEERALVAGACVRKLGIKFPAVLDEFGNSTERAYTGWPDRLYLIDSKGQVAYKSKPGPFGFKPDELGAALRKVVGRQFQETSPKRPFTADGAPGAVGVRGNAEPGGLSGRDRSKPFVRWRPVVMLRSRYGFAGWLPDCALGQSALSVRSRDSSPLSIAEHKSIAIGTRRSGRSPHHRPFSQLP